MDFEINFLSFYVVQVDGNGDKVNKTYQHFQTLDRNSYNESELKDFLDGELAKIAKRKVDRHPKTEQALQKLDDLL